MWLPRVPITGVGLIVVQGSGFNRKVLMLEESETKPHLGKKAGMLSFPMETCEPIGEKLSLTIARLIAEEMPGITIDQIDIADEPAGLYQIVPGVWVSIWHGKCQTNILPYGHCLDVNGHHWRLLSEAVNIPNLRQGAREALQDCLDEQKQVVRSLCRVVI